MKESCDGSNFRKRDKRKKKKYQVILGVVLLIIVFIIYFLLSGYLPDGGTLAVMWIFGIAFGFVLQRSRFCFTASFRDPYLIKETSLSKAVIIALGLSSLGIVALQYFQALEVGGLENLKNIPGNVSPVGLHTALGGLLFGIGMVIAGGCASGTLMRVGEGFTMNMLALLFFIVGSVLANYHFPLWSKVLAYDPENRLYLPKLIGRWLPALAIHFGMLIILYIIVDWYGRGRDNTILKQ